MSADVYTPLSDATYLLGTPFYLPDDKGDRWAVAFSLNSATLVTAALSIIVTVCFMCVWNIIAFCAMFFTGNFKRNPPRKTSNSSVGGRRRAAPASRRRFAALVTLWNANDSWFAFNALRSYALKCAHKIYEANHDPDPDVTKQTWGDFLFGLTFCLIALVVFASSLIMGIVTPSFIEIGSSAPVRVSTLFYPARPNGNAQELRDFGLRAPQTLRALGSVEAAEVTMRERVRVSTPEEFGIGGRLNYRYEVNGVELGLRGGNDLRLDVTGSCVTEDGWINATSDNADADTYYLWGQEGNDNYRHQVLLNRYDILHAPRAKFIVRQDGPDTLARNSNASYAIVIHSAHRASLSRSDDPWYATEPRPRDSPPAPYSPPYRMKRGRPVLSCWEHDRWSYRSETVRSFSELKGVQDKIAPVLVDVLETAFAAEPMIARLGRASGESALRSGTTSPDGVIDAEHSSLHQDMLRLLVASFVATRSTFADAIMFGNPTDLNVFRGSDGQPREGSGNIAVSSPAIQTFSMTGIVTLVVILAVLLLVNILLPLLPALHKRDPNWIHFKSLAAVELFRCVYDDSAWDCKSSVPGADSETVTSVCCDECKGHIEKSPPGS